MSNLCNNYETPWPKEVLLPLGNCQLQMEGDPASQTEWRKVSGITVCPVVTVEQENGSKLSGGWQLGLRAVLGTSWHGGGGVGHGKRHRLHRLPP